MPFINARRLMLFYRQLAQLVASGMSIIEAINVFVQQSGDYRFSAALARIKQELAAGVSLSEAFSHHPEFFPDLHVNIIKYSETSGRLVQGITGLADNQEKEYTMLQNLLVGLAYPAFVLHVAMFLLPVFNALSGNPGGYLKGFLGIFLTVYGLIFLIYLVFRLQNNQEFKSGIDSFVLGIPVIGNIARQFALTRFIRALQALIASGVGIASAWQMAGSSCGNNVIRNSLLLGSAEIKEGRGISQAFIRSGIFPSSMVSLIYSGEKSGSISQTLNTIASYAEKENDTAIGVLTRIAPVFIYILVAGFIGLRIISFYTGYINRIFSFSG